MLPACVFFRHHWQFHNSKAIRVCSIHDHPIGNPLVLVTFRIVKDITMDLGTHILLVEAVCHLVSVSTLYVNFYMVDL